MVKQNIKRQAVFGLPLIFPDPINFTKYRQQSAGKLPAKKIACHLVG
jgi:hypothetical protein